MIRLGSDLTEVRKAFCLLWRHNKTLYFYCFIVDIQRQPRLGVRRQRKTSLRTGESRDEGAQSFWARRASRLQKWTTKWKVYLEVVSRQNSQKTLSRRRLELFHASIFCRVESITCRLVYGKFVVQLITLNFMEFYIFELNPWISRDCTTNFS